MTFTKGHKIKGGRPKGAKNVKTEQWEAFKTYMLNDGLEEMSRDMATLDPKDRVHAKIALMNYFKPKLAQQQLTGKDGKDLPIPILSNAISINDSNQEGSVDEKED